MIQSFDYRLTISTGEELQICELDPGLVSELRDAEVRTSADPWLTRCTRAPRAALEEAKRGHSGPLDRLLRTPPIGILIRNDRHLCGRVSSCSMADKKGCSTRNVDPRRGLGLFPECWSPELPDVSPPGTEELVSYVVRAWRDGRYVILVEG
jgi:hypothetical protein